MLIARLFADHVRQLQQYNSTRDTTVRSKRDTAARQYTSNMAAVATVDIIT